MLEDGFDASRVANQSQSTCEANVVYFGNEFPNDDLKDLFRRLLQRSKDRRFRLLANFLQEATLVLKEEIDDLPFPARDELPHFNNLLTLAEYGDYRDGSLGAAMESAFLVVLQLGMLIGHHEAHDLELDIIKRGTTLAGLSIGLFSGAAVALANSLSDLTKTGPQALKVSWRLGVYVQGFSRSLEAPQPDGTLQSWAHVVTGMTKSSVQEELERYNNEVANPDLVKVFISAADKNSVGVTGPPSRLKAAFQHSTALRYSKSLPLPVYDGVCHASHIYQQEDIAAICSDDKSKDGPLRKVQAVLLSSQTGKPFAATTSNELYLEICTELLTGTIYMDNITAGLVDRIGAIASLKSCRVQTFRTSLILKGMLQTFETEFPHAETSKIDMIAWAFEDFVRRPGGYADSKLAIVGMSCRMPGGGNDPEEWWKLLESGYDAHTTVPSDRFDLETHYDPTGQTENATQTPYGNFIDRPGFFDAGFFSMTPKEAEQTDPMHRLALVTAYEAMEMAGFVAGRTASTKHSRVGTWYGQASDDWRELNASQNIGTYAVPGGVRAFATGRLNYFFKFSGPSYDVDTACSSSAAAVQQACSALWAGEVDTAIAGGLNVITDPDNYAGLCNAFFLSKTGQCKVWDKDADGYCRAEGIGSVVIKRLEDAEADNDNILAVVLSSATNHSAKAISITHPHAGAQEANYRQVLHKAGINPLDVSFIEMHGTGTQAGDAIESESILNVFAPTSLGRRKDQPLRLGAVKSNIGHGEAAAGISSIIKTLLCFQKEKVPMHVGIKTEINPTIPKDLARRNVALATADTQWLRQASKPRVALVNSFGASGGNTTLLLEDGPERQKFQAPIRTTHAISISAKSKKSLQANMESLLAYLQENPQTDLADLSYTTCARRTHHNLRLCTSVSSTTGLLKFLTSSLEQKKYAEVRPVPAELPSIVFTFTGQGTSFRGSQELFTDSPIFRKEIMQLDQLVQRLGFQSVVPIVEGIANDDLIASPVASQLSIVVLEIALARFWASLGVKPDAVVGHSLGEYAALAVAGVLSVVDVLYLVGRRAQLTEERCVPNSHVMLSIRASMVEIREVLQSSPGTENVQYELACQNTQQDTVLGGLRADIDAIRQALEAKNFKALTLEMPFAFHTAQMDAVLDDLEQMASRLTFKAPSVPVLSSFLGAAVFDGKTFDAQYLRNQTRSTVNFVGAIEAAQDLGIVDNRTIWVDLGPQPVCTTFVCSMLPQATVAASCKRNEDNLATVTKALVALHLAGLPVAWNEYFRPYESSFSLLNLPKYRWNETNYWIPYYGTWALDKAHYKHGGKSQKTLTTPVPVQSSLKTSLVHQVLKETVEGTTASIIAMSDVQHPDFLEAVHGHQMNNCGVATSSIWSDIALTIGEHAYRLVQPQANVHMNLCEFEVLHAQVASTRKGDSQPLQVEAYLDLSTSSMSIAWYDVDATSGLRAADHFASGTVRFENPQVWRAEWDRVSHLITGRIEALEQMASAGKASKLSKSMAYTLFKNVVDYADKYRGMDSVILKDYEAVADVTLTKDRHGTWHTPPHWIDSVCHLAGLIMNGSDASNTKDFFYVTPGSESLRFIKPLEAGGRYRSYVRMFPLPVEAGNLHAGDVYVLQDDVIVAMLTQIRFRRVPRSLMDRFFAPPNTKPGQTSANKPSVAPASNTPVRHIASAITEPHALPVKSATPVDVQGTPALQKEALAAFGVGPKSLPTPPGSQSGSSGFEVVEVPGNEKASTVTVIATEESESDLSDTASRCLQLIARETSLAMSDLTPDASFSALGVDSLMSLVLAEKLKAELGFEVKSSLFLECPTIGDMISWLEQYS